jgi:hypothetical protein
VGRGGISTPCWEWRRTWMPARSPGRTGAGCARCTRTPGTGCRPARTPRTLTCGRSHSAGDSARAGLGFCPHRYWWATPWSHGGGAADTCVAPLVRPRPLARCSARRYETRLARCAGRTPALILSDLSAIAPVLADLGARHAGYGVSAEHYHWLVARCSRRWPRSPVRRGSRNSPPSGRVPIRRSPRS